jgi:hypothetical protein
VEGAKSESPDRCIYIYIHGTPDECRIGAPATFVCIRMRSRGIIDLYNPVHIGTHILIALRKIHNFVKPGEPEFTGENRLNTPIGKRLRFAVARGSR